MRAKAAGAGHDRLADGNRPAGHRLPLDLSAAGALDRARDAGAHPEPVVGRVRDRIHRQRRDVALDDLELEHQSEPLSIRFAAYSTARTPRVNQSPPR